VSARANALVVRTELPGTALLRALNGIAPEVRFTAATRVPEEFRVRRPHWREYRYYLTSETPRLARWPDLLAHFADRPFDARSFARGLAAEVPCWRRLQEIELSTQGGTFLRVRASSFLWGMVRKIVAAIGSTATGQFSEEQLERALAGAERIPLPMAAPEPLVLWEIDYGIPWEVTASPPTRTHRSWLAREHERLTARARFLPELFAPPPGGVEP
jgi:tRNA pseudouridine(38-40) synthase